MKALLLLWVLAACATPATSVHAVDSRPALAIEGASAGSSLFVDGASMGEAKAYDGQPAVLLVEPGTHEVELRDASGKTIFRQRVFVDSETKTLKVH